MARERLKPDHRTGVSATARNPSENAPQQSLRFIQVGWGIKRFGGPYCCPEPRRIGTPPEAIR